MGSCAHPQYPALRTHEIHYCLLTTFSVTHLRPPVSGTHLFIHFTTTQLAASPVYSPPASRALHLNIALCATCLGIQLHCSVLANSLSIPRVILSRPFYFLLLLPFRLDFLPLSLRHGQQRFRTHPTSLRQVRTNPSHKGLPAAYCVCSSVILAMYEHLAPLGDGPHNQYHLVLYKKWAVRAWDMAITGNVQVSPQHLSLGRNLLVHSTTDDEALGPFVELASAIHCSTAPSLAIMQLSHAGRQSPNILGGRRPFARPLAPSAVRLSGSVSGIISRSFHKLLFSEPSAVTLGQINAVVNEFTNTAVFVDHVGFDGVQIHVAHGCPGHLTIGGVDFMEVGGGDYESPGWSYGASTPAQTNIPAICYEFKIIKTRILLPLFSSSHSSHKFAHRHKQVSVAFVIAMEKMFVELAR